ncbi:MAG TPA: GlsB/YeaQ/YmgE family stress response membrane protein [Patescibacteria group bacterium]|nr:GlsB/YeaQ/YmgE family stress response membrane protein [Patescibacteria group bacterium]
MFLSIIIWLVVGAFAGWVASIIMKTDEQMGAVANIVVGIIGAFLGGWIVSLFGNAPAAGGLNLPSILTAILGAVVLLAILKAIRR